jgi:hypothetical protein
MSGSPSPVRSSGSARTAEAFKPYRRDARARSAVFVPSRETPVASRNSSIVTQRPKCARMIASAATPHSVIWA